MSDSHLETLCRLCGIQPQYNDIWGNTHRVTVDTARALAGAMGIELAGKSIEAVAAELEAAPWRRTLAPVQVLRITDAERTTLVRLPQDQASGVLRYALVLENGERREAEQRIADLARRESYTLDGHAYGAYALPLPELPLGYHRLEILSGAPRDAITLIVAPNACYTPEAVANGGRVWGAALQLYALRSSRNWGIGDFTDLRTTLERLAQQGAGVIGLNPLHALYPHNPLHLSPYSPSSRLFLNVMYLDVEGIAEFAQCAPAQQLVYSREFQRKLEALRAQEFVDYAGVAAAKFPVLEMLYQQFREHHLARNTERAQIFREFQARGGEWLYRHSLYEALQEYFHRQDPNIWGWPVWPEAYRDPGASVVGEWAEQNRARIEYYQYLQWQADRQLGAVGRRSYELGLGVGLYQDLAVSVDRGGAETWAWQSLYARNVSIGAPPDELALTGQDWGLPPLVPRNLREAAYAPFIATLRANMRHGGAVRIDHVMGLMRLYWVPPGASAKDGAYVHYPFADLLGILALESQRNRCLVIGEDLGTVPDEVRAGLGPLKVLSYRLFYFERSDNGEFKPPAAYPEQALAAVSTHDLPTLAGYWKGQDIVERERLNLFPSNEQREQQILARTQDRARLLMALSREGLLPQGMTVDPASCPEMTPALATAIHVYLARSPSQVVMLQLEDIIGETRQANLPGTVDQHPNWRRKVVIDIDALVKEPRARDLFKALSDTRGPGAKPRSTPRPGSGANIPRATYRLQFHRDFTFRDAAALAPYLQQLGVSHCYASPYLKARPGSRHGYDIVDHNTLNPEIGTSGDYEAFVQALHAHQLGQVLDIVPNHMGIGSDNQWWLDVLENGQASTYANFFDIDWYPLKAELRGKVLLPVLGDHYGAVLERGELQLAYDSHSGAFYVHYYQHRFPVDPATYPLILQTELSRLSQTLGPEHARFMEFQSLLAALSHLPTRDERSNDRMIERYRDKELHKRRLVELAMAEPAVQNHIEQLVNLYNGGSNAPGRWDLLHELLERQAYRLAYWRVASDEINYRRFFDVNDLAALRMENPQTFYNTHRLISDLVAQGKVDGLRIDHPDGLHNPLNYYQRLQNFVTTAVTTTSGAQGRDRALYLIVEKILASHEHLPEDWPVHGTTGYDFINLVNGLLVCSDADEELSKAYARFTGQSLDFEQLLAERKRLIMRISLSSELNVLASYLNRLSEADRRARDFTLNTLRYALRELVAFFPVYRTYIRGDDISEADRHYIEHAVMQAKKHSTEADVSVFGYLRRMLLLEGGDNVAEEYRRGMLDFAMRFQQFSAPVMAKGLEDTSFYLYNRLISLNEVGGDPRRHSPSVAEFHEANMDRARRFPHSMLASSTHDTKRSEDVRARINVISEIPGEWSEAVTRWSRINRSKRHKLEDGHAPDRNDEYLLYQTLFGVWPLAELNADGLSELRGRVEAYMLKAVREAKAHTSWLNPNVAYEEATQAFVKALLDEPRNEFLADFVPFVRRYVRYGLYNSLSQVLLKFTVPGVPDIYQGNEIWDFSLVDPDNRRPVDYTARAQMLTTLQRELRTPAADKVRELLTHLDDGRAKLYLTWQLLKQRQALPELFSDGEYLPLTAHGRWRENAVAFARRHNAHMLISVATRWLSRIAPKEKPPIGKAWADTSLEVPAGVYRNALTGEEHRTTTRDGKAVLPLAKVLESFSVALLIDGQTQRRQ